MMKTWIVSTLLLAAAAIARPQVYSSEAQIPAELFKRQFGGCRQATLIFCRGTFEPGGPVGSLVGTPFSTVLRLTLGGRLEVKGVSYDAGVVGYLIGGDPAGATTMAQMVTQTLQKCPNTKIILGGYSQGAQVVHLAAAKLSEEEKNKVTAIVVFGDPYKGVAIPGIPSDKIHTICADSDMICWGLPLPIGAHLTYGSDTKNLQAGAAFVKEKISSASSGLSSKGAGSGDSTNGAERLIVLDELSESGRLLPLGAEGNPALVGVVESLFRQAYANVGVMPESGPAVLA